MRHQASNIAPVLGGDPISPAQGQAQKFQMGIKQQSPEELDIYLYGDVESDWYDLWTGEHHESQTSSSYFKKILFEENPQAKTINLYVNSYGGSVFEGTAIANMLRRHPAQVNVVIDAFACSVASVIAMAGDHVVMPKNAVFMIHNAWTEARGNASGLRQIADDLDKIMDANRSIYLEKSKGKITEEKLIELLDAETYLTAEECVEYGFCDEISTAVEVDGSALKTDTKQLEQLLQQRKDIRQALTNMAAGHAPSPDSAEVPDAEPIQPKTYLAKFFTEKKENK